MFEGSQDRRLARQLETTAVRVSGIRRYDNEGNSVQVICNLTPVVRENYRIGVPEAGRYSEIEYGRCALAEAALRQESS